MIRHEEHRSFRARRPVIPLGAVQGGRESGLGSVDGPAGETPRCSLGASLNQPVS